SLQYHGHNISLKNHHLTPLISDNSASASAEYGHPGKDSSEYIQNIEELLTRSYFGTRSPRPVHRNPHFIDLESHQKLLAAQASVHRPYPDYPLFHLDDYDNPMKKHDYVRGQYDGGWDNIPNGFHIGGGGSGSGGGLVHAMGALKKGKEAKALFILLAPLILLAVFGPILATQSMIPWIASGGLNTVSTIAGGKRKRRSPINDPRQMFEIEKRLQLFMEVQDFIAKSGSQNLVEEMGNAFLKCTKYTERRNKCLERVACEYSDETSVLDPNERRVAKLILRNVMMNPLIPSSLKGRLSKGSMFGKKNHGRCINYFCEVIDKPSS
ncbi:uncharacterized protein LOC118198215, partial [Stegodyphus dumicola]|uniref:uncharacterized protein LOC118198215 n=1 Tax=Stegodyphus dumicola TaxID=202533 RepID=UPI0015B1F7FA